MASIGTIWCLPKATPNGSALTGRKLTELSRWKCQVRPCVPTLTFLRHGKHVPFASMMDRTQIKAKQLVDCYLRRWAIETSYRELKHTMLGLAKTLRSTTVDGVNQEIWGALIAYNLVRIEIAKAAHEAKCQPTEISFTLAFRTIQYELFIAAATQAYGKLPALLIRLRQRLVLDLKEFRPDRKFDRVVKAKPQRYPHKKLKTSP